MSLDVDLIDEDGGSSLYSGNITHNLNKMAMEGGFYEALWRPEEIGITRAHQLITPLTDALVLLAKEPDRFDAFNAENGWGTRENLLRFVAEYLAACTKYPSALVKAWR